jgi:hypothetical protein
VERRKDGQRRATGGDSSVARCKTKVKLFRETCSGLQVCSGSNAQANADYYYYFIIKILLTFVPGSVRSCSGRTRNEKNLYCAWG